MDPLIRELMRPEAYDHPVVDLQLLETHLSWVILTGTYAYKFKKPIDLGFANFTTLSLRRHFCEEEVRLNRRLAPELYLEVRPVFGTREAPTFREGGDPIEYAVQMQQFNQRQLLPAVLKRGELRSDHIDRLAELIADFHHHVASATFEDPFGTPASIRAAAFDNLDALTLYDHAREGVALIRAWSEQEFERLTTWFHQRHATGRVRECHGDMHLGNMVLLNDVIRVFDCLEFNPDLRWTDVIAEIAFLVMDLQERGRQDLAFRLLNDWLEQTGDYDGLNGWRWYMVYRALVRAKVAELRLQQDDLDSAETVAKQKELQTYLALAQAWTQPHPAAIIMTHGLSGSGKSYVAARLCDEFSTIRIRSDVERKRLFGQWGKPGDNNLSGDMYTPEITDLVYHEVLAGHIPRILKAGFSPVIDATCLQIWQRRLFRAIAVQEGVPFVILDLQAQPETLRKRLADRRVKTKDPSDADAAILEQQLVTQQPLTNEEQLETLYVNTERTDWWTTLVANLHSMLDCLTSPTQ